MDTLYIPTYTPQLPCSCLEKWCTCAEWESLLFTRIHGNISGRSSLIDSKLSSFFKPPHQRVYSFLSCISPVKWIKPYLLINLRCVINPTNNVPKRFFFNVINTIFFLNRISPYGSQENWNKKYPIFELEIIISKQFCRV